MSKEPRLLRCKVRVSCEGIATARYRWEGLDVDGKDSFDESVSEWSAGEIRDVMAIIIGIEDVDKDKIEIEWE